MGERVLGEDELLEIVRLAASSFRIRLGAEWEDVVGQSVLEVWQSGAAERLERDDLRRWAFRVTSRNCIDALRKATRWRTTELEPEVLAATEDSAAGVDRKETVAQTMDTFSGASAECQAIWRAIIQGRSYQDLAQEMGVSRATVRVRAHRCREWAREHRRLQEKKVRNAGAPQTLNRVKE